MVQGLCQRWEWGLKGAECLLQSRYGVSLKFVSIPSGRILYLSPNIFIIKFYGVA